ncbi:protein of unknown function DUF1552 [Chthoniobacter flavus Ellin428]|uniref:DUF1552 domain-containing protein n=1 Tax=Chthoniobacter flavus Ellin428 TaxID=497964 RepID=B4CUT4_9BACT|nr:DUF1552 domain-containing protein [Chthoniobacter flavus]EDY22322.1 protein of unknown function DUF1552 [Chthoniobacter flavus Ellin428]TCO94664.1 uncharacterized protein DUF1552 [Chthoniobacter flavus]
MLPTSRRRFLQSTTAFIALPVLESLGFRRFASAAAPVAPPKRMLFLSFGWGVTQETWYPDQKPGADYVMPKGLLPLERHRKDISIVQGLWNRYSNEGHWGSTFWLTGANRYEEPGLNFHNSISADQVAAAQLGLSTRFASLQFNGAEGDMNLSGHGPGLSLAWDVNGKPVAGLNGPLAAYHRLFAKDTTPIAQQQTMLAEKRSVLDTVMDGARTLQRGLNRTDHAKLDEYFQSIRDIETRLSKEEQWMNVPRPPAPFAEPREFDKGREEIKLMYDIMLAAMHTDSTRVMTYRQPVASLLTSLEIKVFPHDMSHYSTTLGEKLDASQRRDFAQSELLAGFIDKLKNLKEVDGSRLFDNVSLAYGSNIRTAHELNNCPTILTGGAAGLKLGRNIVAPKDTPLCNAWLALLHGVGIKAERHGDSSGVLKEIIA